MAKSRFLQTPTGQTYAPAASIERGFDKTAGIITGAIEDRARYKQEQDAAFGQMYSNLGELEANLQQNYAGINQQMVDSTREFMKEHYKKGGKSTDPNFQAQLGQLTGRIKASMSNADRNREMLKQTAELIKADNSITDKASALAGMYQKINDPDFLISQNTFNPDDFLSNYVDSRIVFEQAWKSLPTTGEWNQEYTDKNGNLRATNILTNPLINKDAPVNEDGSLNIQMTPEFIQDAMSGKYGQRLIDQTLSIANERYSNLPTDVAFGRALKDGLSSVAGLNYSNKVKKSARDIQRENAQMARQNRALDLSIAEEERKVGRIKEAEDIENRFEQFVNASSSGDIGFLGEYENQKSGIKDFKWVTSEERYKPELEAAKKVETKESWASLPRDERKKIIEDLNLGDQIPSDFGRWDTNSDEAYSIVKTTMDNIMSSLPSGTTSIRYKQKAGYDNKKGEPVYEEVELPVTNQQELENAFRALENLRRSGQKMKPVTEVEKPKEVDLTQKSYWN